MRRSAYDSVWMALCATLSFAVLAVPNGMAEAGDWTRFRGPNGSGLNSEMVSMPVTWSPTENLKWKVELPGPGSSSPIIVGDKVFVTCWSGYGMTRNDPDGKQENLKRHLLCLDRQTGKTLWDKTVAPYLPEDNYRGMFAENGYASHTPASDGERVYVFFGKSGALAFDMQGNQLWQTSLGTGSGEKGWGSSSSPILYKNLVIITAAAESQAMYALDKTTGKQVWEAKADGFGATWGTPVLVEVDDTRTDIVLGVPNEIWGFNADTGKLAWYCDALSTSSFCSSVVTDGKLIYAMGDQGSGSIAVKVGGVKDVTKTHIAWTGKESNRIGSPVIANDKLYFVSNKVASCVDAKTGTRVFQGRLSGGSAPAAAAPATAGAPRRGRGGAGGGRGGQDYSSPVAADGKLYFVARNGDVFVTKLGDKFELLATNKVTQDSEDFSATPAVDHGALFLRSSKHLYCIERQ